MMQDPFVIFENEQEEFLKLCAALEEIADALPGNVDFCKAEAALVLLKDGFTSHITSQEDLLFPFLRQRAPENDNIEDCLAQLEYEHAIDQGLSVEVSEALGDLVGQRRAENPERLGYLLRCFFEGYRRHCAWEKIIVFPVCRKMLTAEDRASLASRVADLAQFAFGPRLCTTS
jgi:hemerythrin-like domain-containing protein